MSEFHFSNHRRAVLSVTTEVQRKNLFDPAEINRDIVEDGFELDPDFRRRHPDKIMHVILLAGFGITTYILGIQAGNDGDFLRLIRFRQRHSNGQLDGISAFTLTGPRLADAEFTRIRPDPFLSAGILSPASSPFCLHNGAASARINIPPKQ